MSESIGVAFLFDSGGKRPSAELRKRINGECMKIHFTYFQILTLDNCIPFSIVFFFVPTIVGSIIYHQYTLSPKISCH